MGPWDHFWFHWFQLWGQQAALEIYSSLEKMTVIRVVQHTNLKLLEDKQYWVGRIIMSPFLLIA